MHPRAPRQKPHVPRGARGYSNPFRAIAAGSFVAKAT
jgi:hypothetical protein